MNIKLSRKQAGCVQIILATALFTSAFLQSIRSRDTVDEQISSRIGDAIGALIEQNESTVYDWASWDDTVELAQQRYDNYFVDNFNEDTSRIIQLSVVVDNANELISGIIWNEESDSFVALKPAETKNLSVLLQECGTSFTATFTNTYLISSSFISPTDSKVDDLTYGCLFFGKRIPDAALSEIFANLINNPKLNIKSISIQPTSTEAGTRRYSKKDLTIQGSQSGLFGSDVIAVRNKPIFSPYQLLIIGLYSFLVVMMKSRRNAKEEG